MQQFSMYNLIMHSVTQGGPKEDEHCFDALGVHGEEAHKAEDEAFDFLMKNGQKELAMRLTGSVMTLALEMQQLYFDRGFALGTAYTLREPEGDGVRWLIRVMIDNLRAKDPKFDAMWKENEKDNKEVGKYFSQDMMPAVEFVSAKKAKKAKSVRQGAR
jgi:hypothetical protein